MKKVLIGTICDNVGNELLLVVGEPINIIKGIAGSQFLLARGNHTVASGTVDNSNGALQEFLNKLSDLGYPCTVSSYSIAKDLAGYTLTSLHSNICLVSNVDRATLDDCDSMGVSYRDYLLSKSLVIDANLKLDNEKDCVAHVVYSPTPRDLPTPEEVRGIIQTHDAARGSHLETEVYPFVSAHSVSSYEQNDDDFLCVKKFTLSEHLRENVCAFNFDGLPGSTKTSFTLAQVKSTGYPCFFMETNEAITVDKLFLQTVAGDHGFETRYSALYWLIKLGVPFYLILDEFHMKPNECKALYSGITSGVISLRQGLEVLSFDPQIFLGVFGTYNPDSSYKIESSVHSRTNLILRDVNLEEELAYSSADYVGDFSGKNLYLVNKCPLLSVNATLGNGILKPEDYFNIESDEITISISPLNEIKGHFLPKFMINDKEYELDSSRPTTNIKVDLADGLNVIYVRPSIDESMLDINNLSAKHYFGINSLYHKMQDYVNVAFPIRDMSGITNDSTASKLDKRHIPYFIDSIFNYRSVSYAVFKMLRNLIQPEVTKFLGTQAPEYPQEMSWSDKATRYALKFIQMNGDLINSLHKSLFLVDEDVTLKVKTAFLDMLKNYKVVVTNMDDDGSGDINLTTDDASSTTTSTKDSLINTRSSLKTMGLNRMRKINGGN